MKGPQMAWVPKDMLTLLSLTTRYALTVTAPGMPIGTTKTYVIKKKTNGKVVAHKVGKMKTERG
jgi:hypothetical protein